MDLAGFLAARLDEDEAVAKAAAEDSGTEWSRNPEGVSGIVVAGGEIVVYDEGRPTEAEAEHIALNDPARVLREVEANRKIIELHKPDGNPNDQWYGASVCCEECGGITGDVARGGLRGFQRSWPCRTLRLLSTVYSDHPDYDPAWA